MKIFLLEDDFALNKIIKLSLQNRGFFVDSFTDGYKAVDAILNSKHDLYSFLFHLCLDNLFQFQYLLLICFSFLKHLY